MALSVGRDFLRKEDYMTFSKLITQFENFFKAMGQPNFYNKVLEGLANTVLIAVLGLLIGVVIGTLIAVVKVSPKYKLIMRILDKICDIYIAIFRGTPMMAQLLVAYYLLFPMMKIQVSGFVIGFVVFGMNSGAYVAEIMRGGLNSVDRGQMEAGRALGLSYATTMIKIVVPQAFKNIVPTLGNEFITLIKETSVLSFISIMDLYSSIRITAQPSYAYAAAYLFMSLVYITLVLIITVIIKVVERAFSASDRNRTGSKSKKGVKKNA